MRLDDAAGRTRSIRRFFIAMLLPAALAWGSEKVAPSTSTATAALAKVEWKKLEGKVEGCDLVHRKLSIRDKNGNLTHVTVDRYVQIFRDWRLIELNDVNLKDHLVLKRSINGVQ